VHRLFGQVELSDEAHERRQNPTRPKRVSMVLVSRSGTDGRIYPKLANGSFNTTALRFPTNSSLALVSLFSNQLVPGRLIFVKLVMEFCTL
jgi:hypothetical protein